MVELAQRANLYTYIHRLFPSFNIVTPFVPFRIFCFDDAGSALFDIQSLIPGRDRPPFNVRKHLFCLKFDVI